MSKTTEYYYAIRFIYYTKVHIIINNQLCVFVRDTTDSG